MNIFEEYLDLIKKLILKNQKNLNLKNLNEFRGAVVEIPPSNFDCDLSSNVCLILGKINKIDPKSLAKQILNKSFNPKLISKMSDEDAINYLSNLRQIGRWSAEMILLFTYNRSNIWPIQDIGLLRAISKNYNKKYLPPMKFVNLLKKRFSPYCSVATWYLWRSIDPEPIQY